MRLNVKSHQIRSQQAIHQFALPRANPKRLGIRPGNMPENRYSGIRPLLFDHSRQQREVVILHQNHRLFGVLHFFEQGIGELTVDGLILFPIVGSKDRTRVRDMTERPDSFIGEAVVISFLFFLGEPNSPQRVLGSSGGTASRLCLSTLSRSAVPLPCASQVPLQAHNTAQGRSPGRSAAPSLPRIYRAACACRVRGWRPQRAGSLPRRA